MNGRLRVAVVAAFSIIAVSADTSACSPVFEEPFELQPVPASGETMPVAEPVARVVDIQRGRKAKRGEDTCAELAYLIIAVRDDSPKTPFLHAFRQVSAHGSAPSLPQGLYLGRSNGKGEQQFTFYWFDTGLEPAPFSLEVEITPYSRAGTPGPAVRLMVEDGRKHSTDS